MSKPQTLAVVGGKEITGEAVEAILKSMDPQRASQYRSEEGQKRLLDEAIHQQLLYLDAVDSELEEDEEFQEELKRVKSNMLRQYALSKLMDHISVNEQEAKTFYKENKGQFINPVSIKASHILIKNEQEAQQVYEKIQQGVPFEDAAKDHSNCEGVDLGYFAKGQMVQDFEDVAFSMVIDEISPPVKTDFGHHIIKVYDRKVGKSRSYDEVKQELQNFLLTQKRESIYFGKIKALREKYGVQLTEGR